nr:ATP-binding protein [uncultured Cohaesibacter sp.]
MEKVHFLQIIETLHNWILSNNFDSFPKVIGKINKIIGSVSEKKIVVFKPQTSNGTHIRILSDTTNDIFKIANLSNYTDVITLNDGKAIFNYLIKMDSAGEKYGFGWTGTTGANSEFDTPILKMFYRVFLRMKDRNFEIKINNNLDYLLSKKIKPEDRMKFIFQLIVKYISPFGPKLHNCKFQFLALQDDVSTLTLRASSESDEPPNFMVERDRSIVGLCLQQGDGKNFINVDPTDEKYQNLFLDFSTNKSKTKSEFAIPILSNEIVIGVLNIESTDTDFFNEIFVNDVLSKRKILNKYLGYLEEQWNIFYVENNIVASIYDFYLNAHAKSFNHDMQRFDQIGAFLADIEDLVHETTLEDPITSGTPNGDKFQEIFDYLVDDYKATRILIRSHTDKFSNIGKREDKNLRNLVEESLKDFRVVQKEGNSVSIFIENKIPNNIYIKETSQLNAYIHQILDNSREHLNIKAEKYKNESKNFTAKISITFSYKKVDNIQWIQEYGVLKIRDNGPGVSPDERKVIEKMDLGMPGLSPKRKGTRRSLVGVHRYMQRHGGWVEINTRKNGFFEVGLVFPSTSISRSED